MQCPAQTSIPVQNFSQIHSAVSEMHSIQIRLTNSTSKVRSSVLTQNETATAMQLQRLPD